MAREGGGGGGRVATSSKGQGRESRAINLFLFRVAAQGWLRGWGIWCPMDVAADRKDSI